MANVTPEEREAMIAEMDALLGLKDDPSIPPSAVTVREYAEQKGITYDQAKGLLNKGTRDGKLARKKALRETEAGSLRDQWVYWIAVV